MGSRPFASETESCLTTEGLKEVSGFGEGDVYTPEAGLARAQVVLDSLKVLLEPKNLGGNGGKRLETWKKELAALQAKIQSPKRFLIAVVGASEPLPSCLRRARR